MWLFPRTASLPPMRRREGCTVPPVFHKVVPVVARICAPNLHLSSESVFVQPADSGRWLFLLGRERGAWQIPPAGPCPVCNYCEHQRPDRAPFQT